MNLSLLYFKTPLAPKSASTLCFLLEQWKFNSCDRFNNMHSYKLNFLTCHGALIYIQSCKVAVTSFSLPILCLVSSEFLRKMISLITDLKHHSTGRLMTLRQFYKY